MNYPQMEFFTSLVAQELTITMMAGVKWLAARPLF